MKKKCPRCKSSHEKKGVYCSKSCANVRVQTDELKARKSETQRRYYHLTEEGAAVKRRASERLAARRANRSDPSVYVPKTPYQDTDYVIAPTESDSRFLVAGGDVWEELDF
jgi:hypothetical protein